MERFFAMIRSGNPADPHRPSASPHSLWGWWHSLHLSRRLLVAVAAWIVFLLASVMSSVLYSAAIIDDEALGGETRRAEAALQRYAAEGVPYTAMLASRIEDEQGLVGARFDVPDNVASDENALPIPDGGGEVLVWRPRALGSDLFGRLAPLRVGATAVFLLGVGYAFLRLYRLADELERRRRVAHGEARRDSLTGLTNRLGFDEKLAETMRSGSPVGLVTLDLDGFKKVNDVHGHGAGDELLRVVADRLRARAEPTDIVARIGGDEFAVLRAKPFDRESFADFAAELTDALGVPIRIGTDEHIVRASFGVALAPFDATGAEGLLREADIRLYADKHVGRQGTDSETMPKVA